MAEVKSKPPLEVIAGVNDEVLLLSVLSTPVLVAVFAIVAEVVGKADEEPLPLMLVVGDILVLEDKSGMAWYTFSRFRPPQSSV